MPVPGSALHIGRQALGIIFDIAVLVAVAVGVCCCWMRLCVALGLAGPGTRDPGCVVHAISCVCRPVLRHSRSDDMMCTWSGPTERTSEAWARPARARHARAAHKPQQCDQCAGNEK